MTLAILVSLFPFANLTKSITLSIINAYALQIWFGLQAKINVEILLARLASFGMDLAAKLFLVLLDHSTMVLNVYVHNFMIIVSHGSTLMAINASILWILAHREQDGTKIVVSQLINVLLAFMEKITNASLSLKNAFLQLYNRMVDVLLMETTVH